MPARRWISDRSASSLLLLPQIDEPRFILNERIDLREVLHRVGDILLEILALHAELVARFLQFFVGAAGGLTRESTRLTKSLPASATSWMVLATSSSFWRRFLSISKGGSCFAAAETALLCLCPMSLARSSICFSDRVRPARLSGGSVFNCS